MAVFGVLDPNVPQTCHVRHGGFVLWRIERSETSLAFALACCRRNNRSNAFWRDPGAFLMLKRCGLTTTALFVERPVRGSCVCQFDMPTRRWSFWHCAEHSNDAFVVVAVAGNRNFVVRRT